MNEAEAVNAQRDAQRAGEMGTILDTSVRLGAYTFSDALWPQNATTLNADVKKFTANIYRNLNAKYEVGHPIAKEWEQPDPITSPVRSLHEMGRGKSADRPEYPVDLPDCFRVLEGYRERIAYLERQRDAAASARANALERIADLERQRDAAMELLADARAEAARHAGYEQAIADMETYLLCGPTKVLERFRT